VSPAWYDDYVLTVGSVNVRGEPSASLWLGVVMSLPLAKGWYQLISTGDGLATLLWTQDSTPLSVPVTPRRWSLAQQR